MDKDALNDYAAKLGYEKEIKSSMKKDVMIKKILEYHKQIGNKPKE